MDHSAWPRQVLSPDVSATIVKECNLSSPQIIREDVNQIVDELASKLDALAGTTFLITGASGFLCSYLVEVALAWNDRKRGMPCRVIALDNMLTGVASRLASYSGRADITFLNHDISRPLMTDECPAWIVHGASIASPIVYRKFPLETLDANVNGTRYLLELALKRQSRGMLVMSTSEIYGDPPGAMIPTPETYRGNVSCFGPRACYDESKRISETLAYIYFTQHQVPVKMIRPFNFYGPGLRLNDQRVIPDLMNTVLNRDPIVLFSDGKPTRAFCYIADAIKAMLLILFSDHVGTAFNVGNDMEEISMRDLAMRMSAVGAKLMGGAPVPVEFKVSADVEYMTDNPNRRCADLTKLRTAFPDWAPRVSLEEGLERTLISYLQMGLGKP